MSMWQLVYKFLQIVRSDEQNRSGGDKMVKGLFMSRL